MKQTSSIISTYAADVSGVCSALYELGGMVVMHDPSGCNSTYNTHDEPRWYDYDSLIFISALTEMEAIMGDDQRLIDEVTEMALELKPKFIAIAGSPVPMVVGTDFKAIARIIEKKTGIPCFGFTTNGMHSYLTGAAMALEAVAERMTDVNIVAGENTVNILGATPLDFSVNGSVEAIKEWLTNNGFSVNSCWAMGSTLEELARAGGAKVNLVVSYSGLKAAKVLLKKFGTPYVVGVPMGTQSNKLVDRLNRAIETGMSNPLVDRSSAHSNKNKIVLIGESLYGSSLASAIEEKSRNKVQFICPLESEKEILGSSDCFARDETELIPLLSDADVIIADPLYKPICPQSAHFVSLGHEAFSGRIFRESIPNLIAEGFDKWFDIILREVIK